jgi:threonine dehydrogenase-like Zn-dependent dehydrogenase
VCSACAAGASNTCARLRLIGIDRDGALAGRFAAAEARLHPIPDVIPDAVATLAEPLAVAVHAVRRLPPLVGSVVVVVGGGPVGCLVAHVARRSGGEVLLAERAPARRDAAAALGFTLLDTDDPVADVVARTGGRLADVVVDAAAAAPVAAMLGRLARPCGTIAIVGAYGAPVPIDLQAVMFKELAIAGHRTYLPDDIDAAIGILAADHATLGALVTSVVAPDQVGETIAAMRRGEGMKAVVRV